jgi:hypothetical protein
MVKRRDIDYVMWGLERRTQVNLCQRIETCIDGTKTGVLDLLQEKHGRYLLTVHAVSGVKEA